MKSTDTERILVGRCRSYVSFRNCSTPTECNDHIRTTHRKEEGGITYCCPQCDFKTFDHQQLRAHLDEQHRPSQSRRFAQCTLALEPVVKSEDDCVKSSIEILSSESLAVENLAQRFGEPSDGSESLMDDAGQIHAGHLKNDPAPLTGFASPHVPLLKDCDGTSDDRLLGKTGRIDVSHFKLEDNLPVSKPPLETDAVLTSSQPPLSKDDLSLLVASVGGSDDRLNKAARIDESHFMPESNCPPNKPESVPGLDWNAVMGSLQPPLVITVNPALGESTEHSYAKVTQIDNSHFKLGGTVSSQRTTETPVLRAKTNEQFKPVFLQLKTLEAPGEGYIACKICNNKYSSVERFKLHLIDLHRKPKCPVCRKLMTEEIIMSHFSDKHKNFQCLLCPKCSFTTVDQAALTIHDYVYHRINDFPFACPICFSVDFDTTKDLLDHAKKSHRSTYRRLVNGFSSKCGKLKPKAANPIECNQHIATSHKKEEGGITYCCPHCNFKTFDNQQLRAHLDQQHRPSRSRICAERYMSTGMQQLVKKRGEDSAEGHIKILSCKSLAVESSDSLQQKVHSKVQIPAAGCHLDVPSERLLNHSKSFQGKSALINPSHFKNLQFKPDTDQRPSGEKHSVFVSTQGQVNESHIELDLPRKTLRPQNKAAPTSQQIEPNLADSSKAGCFRQIQPTPAEDDQLQLKITRKIKPIPASMSPRILDKPPGLSVHILPEAMTEDQPTLKRNLFPEAFVPSPQSCARTGGIPPQIQHNLAGSQPPLIKSPSVTPFEPLRPIETSQGNPRSKPQASKASIGRTPSFSLNKWLTCEDCLKVFKTVESLAQHREPIAHDQADPATPKSQSTETSGRSIHVNSNPQKPSCEDCRTIFSTAGDLASHRQLSHGQPKCPICQEACSREVLVSHVYTEHHRLACFLCRTCSFSTIHQAAFSIHEYVLHKLKEFPVKCPVRCCPSRRMFTSWALINHATIAHKELYDMVFRN